MTSCKYAQTTVISSNPFDFDDYTILKLSIKDNLVGIKINNIFLEFEPSTILIFNF